MVNFGLIRAQINLEPIKAHVGRHKKAYFVGSLIVVAGVTFVITRGHYTKVLNAQGGDAITIKPLSLLSNQKVVTVITRGTPGPPSYVVRCLETGEITTSQSAMAIAKGISESDLSMHLNGMHEHVGGLHFERICMAA